MKPKHLFSAAVAVLLLAGCSNDTETVSPSGLVLDPTTLEIVKGETYTLRATVEPADAAYGQISWVSDAPEIASVDAEGAVTALAVGEATVTASVGSDISASCRVTVVGPAAESLTLNAAALTLTIGEQSQLTATPSPEDANLEGLAWSSSDSGVASVDGQGLVTAVAAGQATVRVAVGSAEASCVVTVVAPAQVGDYFYADGTWSTELAADKQCIGIVFAVGHSEYDASDYSSTGIGKAKCNGYVIALNDASTSYAMWGPKGQELGCYPKDEFGDPIQNGRENGQYNDWSGYLYSCLAKADADQNGGLSAGAAEGHPLFYYAMVAYADAVPAPGTTSGWFLPAISQLYQSLNVADRIASVEGGKKLANDWYGSSSEAAVDNPGPQDYFRYLMNMGTPSVSADGKDGAWFYTRSVLAF
jgi:hypothetical protein